MPVKNSERCDFVDPETGKRCGRRATYYGDGKFCEGIGHDPAYPDEEEFVETCPICGDPIDYCQGHPDEIDPEIPDDFETGTLSELVPDPEPEEKFEWDFEKSTAKPEPAVRTCQCGCGEPVAKGRIYEQGHDQRHKGILIRAAIAGDDKAMKTLIDKKWRTREYIVERRTKEIAKQERKLSKITGNDTPKVEVIMEFEAQ